MNSSWLSIIITIITGLPTAFKLLASLIHSWKEVQAEFPHQAPTVINLVQNSANKSVDTGKDILPGPVVMTPDPQLQQVILNNTIPVPSAANGKEAGQKHVSLIDGKVEIDKT